MSGTARRAVVWLSGKPATGKSTLAAALSSRLRQGGVDTLWLDGERVRRVLAPELSFTSKDQHAFDVRLIEAVRDATVRHDIVVVSAAAPAKAQRDFMRSLVPRFVDVVVTAPAELCAQRDPKGLYGKVRSGKLAGVPGIDLPYDDSTSADLVISTESASVDQLVTQLVAVVRQALEEKNHAHI